MAEIFPIIPISIKEETVIEDSLEIIKVVRPNWDFNNVKSKLYTDGITNKLIGFYLDGKIEEEVVMIKIYGQNTETMIDRKAEIDTMNLLHEKQCGPELYAIFDNGICYEFIQGATLNMETCRSPKVYPIVAAEMARVHSTIPIIRTGKQSKMWDKLKTFNNLVEEIIESNKNLVEKLSAFGFDVQPGFGTRAIVEMRALLEAQNMPVTFCHNDLLLGNIIYNAKTSKVSFIDFEYAMPNYPAFDVANHFNEFAGIDNPDFSQCPNKEFKSKWIAEYLKNFKIENVELSQETFENWVELCMPASHLFWALWAIVQAQNSTIDFDFAGYFALRFVEYQKMMKEIRGSL